MSQLYQSADITTVTGAIGPLYYATVTVEGTPVRALVDPGSSATIMSFNLFQKIGKAAHIPASALQKPDVALRDYSQNSIAIGACVHLAISFQDLSITTPVYIYPNESVHSEQCLLGTNVVIPLNLMVPHANLVPHPSASESPHSYPATTAMIQLVKAARIPARTGIVVDAVLDRPLLPPYNLLMFEALEALHQPAMIYIENAVTEWSEDGHIQLFIQNTSPECQDLPSEITLGYVTMCHICSSDSEIDDTCVQTMNVTATSNDNQSGSGTTLSVSARTAEVTSYISTFTQRRPH